MSVISKDILSRAIATAINRAALSAFAKTNNEIKSETGIQKISIYSNTRFRRATANNLTATLIIKPTKFVPVSEFDPYQMFRKVGLQKKLISDISEGFITFKMRGITTQKPMVFQRYGNSRKIRKPKTMSLSDFYTQSKQDSLISHFGKLIQQKLNEELAKGSMK